MFLTGTSGAQAVSNSLLSNINVSSLFDIIVPFIPFIASIILFAFIYHKYLKIREFWKGY